MNEALLDKVLIIVSRTKLSLEHLIRLIESNMVGKQLKLLQFDQICLPYLESQERMRGQLKHDAKMTYADAHDGSVKESSSSQIDWLSHSLQAASISQPNTPQTSGRARAASTPHSLGLPPMKSNSPILTTPDSKTTGKKTTRSSGKKGPASTSRMRASRMASKADTQSSSNRDHGATSPGRVRHVAAVAVFAAVLPLVLTSPLLLTLTSDTLATSLSRVMCVRHSSHVHIDRASSPYSTYINSTTLRSYVRDRDHTTRGSWPTRPSSSACNSFARKLSMCIRSRTDRPGPRATRSIEPIAISQRIHESNVAQCVCAGM